MILIVSSCDLPTVDTLGVDVVRVYCASLMTSLEMAGMSLTLIKLNNPKWVWLLGEDWGY